MAWIELHQSLWSHRKTFRLARLLDIDETAAGGYLARFWTWALDNAPDGVFEAGEPEIIAYGAGWRQEPAAFAEALVAAGWLDAVTEDQTLYIHDWHDYAGRLLERRERERQRSATRRSPSPQPQEPRAIGQRVTEEQPPVVPPETGERPPVDRATTDGTVPNRTEPNQTEPAAAAREAERERESDTGPPLQEEPSWFRDSFGTLEVKLGRRLRDDPQLWDECEQLAREYQPQQLSEAIAECRRTQGEDGRFLFPWPGNLRQFLPALPGAERRKTDGNRDRGPNGRAHARNGRHRAGDGESDPYSLESLTGISP